jgi:hypothetical protein
VQKPLNPWGKPRDEIPLDATSRPVFAKRGLHFNGWPFHYPYTFRAWREADWQRYLDILAYQQVNLFYLEHQALTVRSLTLGLPEPWWLVSGQFKYLPLCRQLGVLPKTVVARSRIRQNSGRLATRPLVRFRLKSGDFGYLSSKRAT